MQSKHILPPGPRRLPFLGNVLQFRHDQLGYLLQLEQTYGRMATVYIGKTPIVLLFRPEHVRYVLTENPRNFTNREVAGGLIFGNLLVLTLLACNFTSKVTKGLHDLVGDGLLTTDGDFHRLHRRLLQPAFSKRRVENYADMFVQYTREAIEHWQPEAEIDIARDLQTLILRMTMKMLVNIDMLNESIDSTKIIDDLLGHPIGILEGLLNLQIDLPITPYGQRMAARRKADAYLYNLIDRRITDKRDVGDILSILLSSGDNPAEDALTRQQVRDELVSLIAAGHETTTNTLTWTFYLLSQHPTILKNVLSELQTVLAGRDPQIEHLPHLTYLDWVVKESMRLYPSAWTQGRYAVGAFDLDGYHFPAGTMLMFSQWVFHRLPDIWEDPEIFRPERWDPLNGQRVPQWAYFPFGGGTRICIGMPFAQLQTRLVLATILTHYIPRVVLRYPVVPLPLITLRQKYGLRVRLEPTPALVGSTFPTDIQVKT
ncbi:MAG: cytochrome P450 [Ktedonobacteraceae bacterium]